MAEAVEVSTRTIGNYENGRTMVRGSVLKVWAIRTGVPLDWLRTGHHGDDGDHGGQAVTIGYPTRPLAPVVHLKQAA